MTQLTASPESLAYVAKARARTTGRVRRVTTILGLAVVLAFLVSLSLGDFLIPVWHVPSDVVGRGDPAEVLVVQHLRLPRAILALPVGAALGMSGAVFQALARNPLASPDILGITAGGSLTAVIGLTVLGLSGLFLSFAATGGALVTAVLIYVLAYRQGLSSYRLVLVGIGVGAIALALIQFFWTRAHTYDAASAALWLSGSLNGRGIESIWPILVMLAVAIPGTLVLAKRLGVLELGDDTAAGVGLAVQRSRALLLLAAVALAGAAIGAAGPVAFVAFVSGPIARRLTRAGSAALVQAALTGAVLVSVADLVGRTALSSSEVSVGVITGIAGAPYLLWLLARTNKSGRGN
ncbi:FecCD family ABC transporter permease [Kribbella sp. GL6]|uniref:FecCD family ABC transporter permease n=1 Tax=Kribbella sp. GL6 TaxID=3419765 RepID=UPI003D015F31